MKLTIEFKDCWENDTMIPETDRWMAWFEEIRGMVETGSTKQCAFDQLMNSLRVKILYDNNNICFDIK